MTPQLQLTLLCIGCFLAGAGCCQVFNWWLLWDRSSEQEDIHKDELARMFNQAMRDDLMKREQAYRGDKYL
jgi:hypothetical protein